MWVIVEKTDGELPLKNNVLLVPAEGTFSGDNMTPEVLNWFKNKTFPIELSLERIWIFLYCVDFIFWET